MTPAPIHRFPKPGGPARASGCPTDLELELELLGEAPGATSEHLRACTACAGQLQWMRDAGKEFERTVLPATLALASRKRSRQPPWLWLAAMAPLAMALGLIVAPVLRQPDGIRSAPVLSLTVDPDGHGRASFAGQARGRARIRLEGSPRYIWLVALDQRGVTRRLYPPPGREPRRQSGLLAEEIDIGDGTRPEQLFAILSEQPIPFETAADTARSALRSGRTLSAFEAVAWPVPQSFLGLEARRP